MKKQFYSSIRLAGVLVVFFIFVPSASGRGVAKIHPGDEGSPEKAAFDNMKTLCIDQIEGLQIEAIAEILASQPYEATNWQAAAFALDEYFKRQELVPAHSALLHRAFTASIKPKDHWLLYDNIINFQTPYRLRKQLAGCLTAIRTGTPSRTIPEIELLSENPLKWLEKWGGHSTGSQQPVASSSKEPVVVSENTESHSIIPTMPANSQESGVKDKRPAHWVWIAITFAGGMVFWRFFRKKSVH